MTMKMGLQLNYPIMEEETPFICPRVRKFHPLSGSQT